jgi:hypothetical protein
MVMYINPTEGRLAGLFSFVHTFCSWLIGAGFFIAIGKAGMEVVASLASSRSTRIPSLGTTFFGTGTNVGIFLAPALAAAVLALWGTVIFLVGNMITGGVYGFVATSLASSPFNGWGSGVAEGLNWLNAAFPLDMFLNAVVGYFVFRVTMIKVTLACLVAMRFLPE